MRNLFAHALNLADAIRILALAPWQHAFPPAGTYER